MSTEVGVQPELAVGDRGSTARSPIRDDSPRPGWETEGLRRFSALDGIRAFAVLAVLCYHAGISWVGGGLLGVDVFFVLSGFLITSLLCRELARTATVRLGRFWANRARRLLPALVITLLGVAAYAYVFRGSLDLGRVRSDVFSTFFYVANWHFIFSDQGYFAQAAAPSPLLHTWSLAVEEQYYLVWPVVALLVVRRWGARALAYTAGTAALASAFLMGLLFVAGASIDRLYYGTDTRAQALLVGSALGAMGAHRGRSFSIVPDGLRASRRQKRCWAGLGVAGAAGLAWAWHALGGQDPFLYRGGFLIVALAAGAVITGCVTVPESLLARFLSLPVLVFVGRISYGLYLYHWPLFLAVDHAHTGLSGTELLVIRMATTFAVATASFYLVEEPIRRRWFFRGRRGLTLAGGAAAFTAATVVVATVIPAAGATAPIKLIVPLPPAERVALNAQHAFTNDHIRFLMTGDSVALTLAMGLSVGTKANYGVRIYDDARLGCDLDDVSVRLSGKMVSSTSGCEGWRTMFPAFIDKVRPDVVGLMLGRWEVSDHIWHGQWVHVGDAAWDDHLVTELDEAADLLSAQGAEVIFFTMPYVDPPQEAANGTTFSENDPARMRIWNDLVRQAAARRPGRVTVVDLNRILDPTGHYQASLDGYPVRLTDGIHITWFGGLLSQPGTLPTIVRLGLESRWQRASAEAMP